MPGQHARGRIVARLRRQRPQFRRQGVPQEGVQLGGGRAARPAIGQQAGAGRVGGRADQDRAALRLHAVQARLEGDQGIGHAQGVEDFDAGGLAGSGGQIVAAQQQDHRAERGQIAHDAREGALVGGAGIARLEGVPGEDHQISVGVAHSSDDFFEAGQEVGGAGAEPGGRVGRAVALDAQVHVGEVEEVDRIAHQGHPGG